MRLYGRLISNACLGKGNPINEDHTPSDKHFITRKTYDPLH